jgi:hypothetical protein
MESAQEKQVILAYLKLKLAELQKVSGYSSPMLFAKSGIVQDWLSEQIKQLED